MELSYTRTLIPPLDTYCKLTNKNPNTRNGLPSLKFCHRGSTDPQRLQTIVNVLDCLQILTVRPH